MRIRFILLFAFCSSFAFAQVENEQGELHFHSGEAVEASISYFYDKPYEVIVKTNNTRSVYKVEEVKEIKLNNGQKFVGRYLQDEKSAKRYLIFEAIIESPKISLYKGEEAGLKFFYVSKDSVMYRLENNEKEIIRDEKRFKVRDKKYIGTLRFLMLDQQELIAHLDKMQLLEEELTKLVIAYNKGDVTYIGNLHNKEKSKSNWLLFSQYSNYGSYRIFPLNTLSYGMFVGLQHYLTKDSRHSFKYSLDHSTYKFEEGIDRVVNLGVRYEFICRKSEYYNFYFMTHLADITYVLEANIAHFVPRLSPGLGLELKPTSRNTLFLEVNNMLQMKELPKSFSIGLKYDIGQVTR